MSTEEVQAFNTEHAGRWSIERGHLCRWHVDALGYDYMSPVTQVNTIEQALASMAEEEPEIK